MINPIQVTNHHTEQQRCSICETFKPLYHLVGRRDQDSFKDVVDCTGWLWNRLFYKKRWEAICPDCAQLFEVEK